MRQKYQNFEELVKENKQELLNNESEMDKLELRLEKRQAILKPEKTDRYTTQ